MTENYVQASGALFEMVQLCSVFRDSKTFPDCTPKGGLDPSTIRQHFKDMLIMLIDDSPWKSSQGGQAEAQDTLLQWLSRFVHRYFDMPQIVEREVPKAGSMEEHIENMWKLLRRNPNRTVSPFSTLIPLPYPYIVPGGRFGEIYYWDSYFTCLGLVASGHTELFEDMIRNFAYLIDQYGYIPNGNRVYYRRSQPPFFCAMLQLLEKERGFESAKAYLVHLRREHQFWMERAAPARYPAQFEMPTPEKRTVTLDDDTVLNRYWDENNAPREESFREDVALFQQVPANRKAELYHNIRAAAESGWDFSARWIGPDRRLTSIRTTELLPVDLNSLLYNMETQLAAWFAQEDATQATLYAQAAAQRKAALLRYCWNEAQGWFFDYSWRERTQTDIWSLAGVYPLFVRLADESQAAKVAQQIEDRFLQPGGVMTTLLQTGEQWDYNGWAPLQWVTVQGLLNYDHRELAREIARRFVAHVETVFQRTGKMMEKYDVCDLNREGGGGEYPGQDGFGWTNGVVKVFIQLFSLR